MTVRTQRAAAPPAFPAFPAFPAAWLVRPVSLAIAFSLGMLGAGMIVLAVMAPTVIGLRVAEGVPGLAVLAGGVRLGQATNASAGHGLAVGLLPGELALDGALLYLGTVLPTYQSGQVPYLLASLQFGAVLGTLFLGAFALALSGVAARARPLGRIAAGAMTRHGVILITGTILLAIGLGQMSHGALLPPH